ncbi:MAG: hypothetical protein V8S36_08315 [Lachnospiraceae bacterium]
MHLIRITDKVTWKAGEDGYPTIDSAEKVNHAPNPSDVPAEAEATDVNSEYEVDLDEIFEDQDKDELTYKVSINGAEAVEADWDYSFTPTELGTTTFVFTANDVETIRYL